ncbi:MAG: hypothetical protein ACRD28_10970 [Acidobacteriaceae bacterium]
MLLSAEQGAIRHGVLDAIQHEALAATQCEPAAERGLADAQTRGGIPVAAAQVELPDAEARYAFQAGSGELVSLARLLLVAGESDWPIQDGRRSVAPCLHFLDGHGSQGEHRFPDAQRSVVRCLRVGLRCLGAPRFLFAQLDGSPWRGQRELCDRH